MAAEGLIEHYTRKVRGRGLRVVLPEGRDARVVKAARRLKDENIADPILLGNPNRIQAAAEEAQVDLAGIVTRDPRDNDSIDAYTDLYLHRRDDLPAKVARRVVTKPTFYGGMMVASGDADAMVGGAATTTMTMIFAGTLTVGLLKGVATPSSYFLMVLPDFQGQEDKLFVFADCAVNVNPTAEQLADIAITSARSATALLGTPPRVAMLSYSTRGSGTGTSVDKVRLALEKARRRAPDLAIDGEFQVDTAIIPRVAAKKIKEQSLVAGQANVLIFPDLDSGNIAYKLTQYTAGAQAIGPMLQGFARPISDLSRGATVDDIVATTVLTLVQLL